MTATTFYVYEVREAEHEAYEKRGVTEEGHVITDLVHNLGPDRVLTVHTMNDEAVAGYVFENIENV